MVHIIKSGQKERTIAVKKRKRLHGSMSVEVSFIIPMILFLIMTGIMATFYFHDKNILSGAAYETVVVGSTKVRETPPITGEQLEALFRERVGNKCILFPDSSAAVMIDSKEVYVEAYAGKGVFKIKVEKRAAITNPEKAIRDKSRMKEIVDGTKNND